MSYLRYLCLLSYSGFQHILLHFSYRGSQCYLFFKRGLPTDLPKVTDIHYHTNVYQEDTFYGLTSIDPTIISSAVISPTS